MNFIRDNHGNAVQARHIDTVIFNSPPIPQALAGLPAASTRFAGRDRERLVLQSVWTRGGDCVVVSGLAGVGKTELVLQAAHASEFPGGVLFVDLQGYDDARRMSPEQVLDDFLRALGHEAPPRHDQRAALFRTLMADREPMLLVLDNASSAAQVRPLLPGTAQHRVVVTSRHTLSGLDDAIHLELDLLPEPAATELVGSAELAELCGRLPLALRIMAALISEDPDADWADELRSARDRLELLDDGDSQAVHATFELSYRHLDAELRRLFRLLALHPGDEITLDGAAALADLSASRTRKLLRGLRRAHLIEPSGETDWYQFHDLVRLYAQRCLADEPVSNQDEAHERVILYLLNAVYEADGALRETRRSEAFPNRLAALAWMDRHRQILVAATAKSRNPNATVSLATGLHDILRLRNYHLDWVTVSEIGLAAARENDMNSFEAFFLYALGNADLWHGDPDDALAFYEEALEVSSAPTATLFRIGIVQAMAHAHQRAGRLEDAEICYQSALTSYWAEQSSSRVGGCLTGLTGVYSAQGRYPEAIAAGEEAVALARQFGDREAEASTLINLVVAHRLAGDQSHEEALEYIERAITVMREHGDHYREAYALMLLGFEFNAQGNFTEAGRAWVAAHNLIESIDIGSDPLGIREVLP